MKNRQPYPGKEGLMKHMPCDVSGIPTGAPAYYAKVDMADSPLVVGDAWSKENIAPDTLAAALGLTDPQSADIAEAIRKMTGCTDRVTAASPISAGDLVDVSGGSASKGFYTQPHPDSGQTVSRYFRWSAQLDNRRFLLVTCAAGENTFYLTLGTTVGKRVVLGAPLSFSTQTQLKSQAATSVCAVGEGRYAMPCDLDIQNSYPGYVLLFSADDLAVTAIGTPVSVGSGMHLQSECSALSQNRFLYCYQEWCTPYPDRLCVAVCTASGTAVTVGAISSIAGIGRGKVIALNQSTALAVYEKPSGSAIFYRLLQINGSDITIGGEQTLLDGATGVSFVRLTASGVLIGAAGRLLLCQQRGDAMAIVIDIATDTTELYGQLDAYSFLLGSTAKKICRKVSTEGDSIILSPAATTDTVPLALNHTSAVFTTGDQFQPKTQAYQVSLATGCHAVALRDAAPGESLEVAYDGTVYIPGAVAGTYGLSGGVESYAYRDNFLSIKGFWK